MFNMSFLITKCDPGTKLESSLLNISRRGDSAMQCIGNVTQQTDPAICYSGFKRAGNQAFEGVSQIHRNNKRFTFFHPHLPFFQLWNMQIDWHWQFGFLLTLPVIGSFSSKHGLDENTEDSLSGTVQAGMGGEMCQKGDMGSQLDLDGDLGFGWHLVGVQEREGKCPGTRGSRYGIFQKNEYFH